MNAISRHAVRLLACAALLFAPACATVGSWMPGGPERIPSKLSADEVPHALEEAEKELAKGDSERALEWMRAATVATGLPADTRERVRVMLDRASEQRVRDLSKPDSDPEDLGDLVGMDLPRQIAVSAGLEAARRMLADGEPMDAFHLVKKIDTKYPLHHERQAVGVFLGDLGLELSEDHSKFLFFYDRQEDAAEVLEYLILNYPRAPRCDEAYQTLARIYADDREWSQAIDRLEKLVLNHPESALRPQSEATIPRFRLSSIDSPEYDRGALDRARRELEAWLRNWPSRPGVPPELEARVRLDLADSLRRLADSDRGIASFYVRVGNEVGAKWHAHRAVMEARQAGDAERVEEAEEILRELGVNGVGPPPPSGPMP
ncbi:MAG: tetratricopeptide repeat protein [Planctomycetota bacterium]